MKTKHLSGPRISGPFKYIKINNVSEYKEGFNCIVVEFLNPDYSLLFGKIDLIMTKEGSKLSHLSLIAMEYGKSIIQVENINKFKKTGVIDVGNEKIEIN